MQNIQVLMPFAYQKALIRTFRTSFLNESNLSILESFNTNISYQLFDYKITFVNSQLEKTNSKDDFELKNLFERDPSTTHSRVTLKEDI